ATKKTNSHFSREFVDGLRNPAIAEFLHSLKIKTHFGTKYTRLRLFVKRSEKLLNSLDILKNTTLLV
ncbi:MAG: hypothetical protein ACI4MM_00170, partial [Candidatus Ventricola sp.]